MNHLRRFSLRPPLGLHLLMSANLCSCISTFSELQSAKLLGPGRYELTPNISAVNWQEEEDDYDDTRVGLQLGAGITQRVDWRVRYERVRMDSDGFNIVGFGPKFSAIPDRLAFMHPWGLPSEKVLRQAKPLSFTPPCCSPGNPTPTWNSTLPARCS
ncbi:MAG: hypothetical protein EXS58_05985 [Candidatus Latescibacteria bacterium]|nr:hypothetical protein [Candidatus Latescibacterota bacterium]